MTNSAIAERYVRTYLDRDWVGLRAQMTDRIRTRGLLPQFVQESLGRDGAIQLMSGWLSEDDQVAEVRRFDVESLGPKERLNVQYVAESEGNRYLVEHHIFVQVEAGRVKKFDMVCSGWIDLEQEPEISQASPQPTEVRP